MDKKNLLVYSSGTLKIDDTEFEVVERKGTDTRILFVIR